LRSFLQWLVQLALSFAAEIAGYPVTADMRDRHSELTSLSVLLIKRSDQNVRWACRRCRMLPPSESRCQRNKFRWTANTYLTTPKFLAIRVAKKVLVAHSLTTQSRSCSKDSDTHNNMNGWKQTWYFVCHILRCWNHDITNCIVKKSKNNYCKNFK